MAKRVNRDDIDKFHDYSLHIPSRTLYMGSEGYDNDGNESGVDGLLVERFIKNLHILDALSNDPITVILNNVGGDVHHGFAIYDAIKCTKSKVTIRVFGHAMSMGSIILQAADERLMSRNASQMIHYGTLYIDGHVKTAQKWLKESQNWNKFFEKVYLSRIQKKNPSFTLDELKVMLDHDTFLNASESVAMGLADEIIGEEK
jgi:ATP-dependent protease ClpP protease subunit